MDNKTKRLTFLHTSPVHIETFNRLMAELAPDIPVEHIVDETLLQKARAQGRLTPELLQQIDHTILNATQDGAGVILCTCSTIGPGVERSDPVVGHTPVIRVDRPMAERAVKLGSRIIVVAALASTLAPTRELILAEAQKAGKQVEIIERLCEPAWSKFEQGEHEAYLQEIAMKIREAAHEGEVIVLAQASMAEAARLCPEVSVPILSSPRLGLEAAINAYRGG
jgi:hypothetical protein